MPGKGGHIGCQACGACDGQTAQAADRVVGATAQDGVAVNGQRVGVGTHTDHRSLRRHRGARQHGILSQGQRAAVSLCATARHRVGIERSRAADAQVVQAGHRIGRSVAQHRITRDAQGLARTHHHALSADGAAGQSRVIAQRHCAGIGLHAAAGDRACVDGGAAADRQRRQTADAVVVAVAQHRVTGNRQGLAAAGYRALDRHRGAGQHGISREGERAAIGLRACAGHHVGIERGRAADAQVVHAGHRVSSAGADHRIAGDGQRVVVRHHRSLGGDAAAGQRGVHGQGHRASVGLRARARHRVAAQGGRATDGQVIQPSDRIECAVAQYRIAGEGQ